MAIILHLILSFFETRISFPVFYLLAADVVSVVVAVVDIVNFGIVKQISDKHSHPIMESKLQLDYWSSRNRNRKLRTLPNSLTTIDN